MNYDYTYEIIMVDEAFKCMEVVFRSQERDPVHVSLRLPFQGEDLATLIHMYAPVNRWKEELSVYVPPVVGTTGTYTQTPSIARTIDIAKDEKKSEIAAWRYNEEISGVSALGNIFSTDRITQVQMSVLFLSIQNGILTTADWKLIDGSFITLDAENTRVVLSTIVQHIQTCFTKEKELCAQVDLCVNIAELDDIVFPSLANQSPGLTTI